MIRSRLPGVLAGLALALAGIAGAEAAGGYFALGYGPVSRQMAGATTAYAHDAYAGATNPAKWFAAGDRVDIGAEVFLPYRRVERRGSGTVYDFATTSGRDVFLIPEAAVSRRVNERLAWGVTLYGNGGLNTTYRGDNGVAGSNLVPAACGNRPSNFLLGCGRAGLDIMQLILAPGLAWEVLPGHSIGAAPLFALQRFKAYGLQSFAAFSRHPTDVSNRGYDYALGIGARVGWLGRLTPWLDLGASYASKIYMGEFEHYDGLLADGGLDIPANYTIGLATRPAPGWTFTFDWQRIAFGGVRATGNGVLNTLVDPLGKPLGSAGGSGFNWEDQDNFRFGLAWAVRPTLTLRAGYAYGDRAQRDDGINSVTLNMMAPNALHQASVGCTWQPRAGHELHLAYSRYIAPAYSGPSATALLGIGGTERLEAHVDTVMVAWSWLR